jgi:hypothetical protein
MRQAEPSDATHGSLAALLRLGEPAVGLGLDRGVVHLRFDQDGDR